MKRVWSAILLLSLGCGSDRAVFVQPPDEVAWIASLSLRDPLGKIARANVVAGTGLYDLSTPLEVKPGAIVIGFGREQLAELNPPAAETLAMEPVRPLAEDRAALPTPIWLARMSASTAPDVLPTEVIETALTTNWLPRLKWKLIETSSTPGPRQNHALSYDSDREVVRLVGGGVGPTDSWAYDGADWSATGILARMPRSGHAAAYDPVRKRLVVFGGSAECSSDTFELDGGEWMERTFDVVPEGRCDHAMVFDPQSERILLFGGASKEVDLQRTYFDDLWAYDGESWTRLLVRGPQPRRNVAMAYSEALGGVVVHGGQGESSLGDTWIYRDGRWEELDFPVSPAIRSKHAMAYDRERRKLVMYGGWHGAEEFEDTWELDDEGWREVDTEGPPRRCNHKMTFHAGARQVLMSGGCHVAGCGTLTYDELWQYGAFSGE